MKGCTFAAAMLLAGLLHAASECRIHTWHAINSLDGQWKITLKMINQQGVFADRDCNPLTEASLSAEQPLIYGFGFPNDADFDLAYTVTAVKQEAGFQSKACVFVVTAKGPAQPDITAIAYHGAECQWKVVRGVGEDFTVR
ncbi:hypothetical protein [Legionella taurinensis]|nr:hypothetical protein [Legionella taurinensis]MDX1837379.1 hypothetical protein [Legionella taurinensis]STY25650.1 Uncharacterised protein [Legionella taurinensis]